jgi:tetratricopeptide (TPR) repeat protein
MNEVVRTATQRGAALLDLGRAREAEQHLREALAAEPGDTTVLTLLADALLRQERHDEALDTSRSALAAAPENVLAHSIHAAALAGLRRLDDALEAVRRGLALAPEVAGLHKQEGAILLASKEYTRALASIDRAARLDPEDSSTVVLRAAVLFELRRYDDAAAAVDEALRLDPENAEAHRIAGVLALRRGGGKSAVQAHRTALRLDPTDPHSRDGLTTALKSRNPLYGLLLRFGFWLNTLPKGVRIAVLLAPFVVSRLLRPFEDQVWALVLIIAVTVAALLSWTLEPVMNLVLVLGRERHLLTREARHATYLFVAFLAAGVTVAVISQGSGPAQLLAVAIGLGFWAMATGSSHLLAPGTRKIVLGGAAGAVAIGAMAVVAVAVGAPAATVAVAVLLLSGIAAVWFTAFAN